MSDIAYCRKCDRIKHVDEDCNYLGCNPELEQREVPAGELYEELREMHDRLAAAEQRATNAEALVGECAEAMIAGSNKIILLVDALGITGAEDDPLVQAALHEQEVVQGRLLTLGLRARDSAPATQPDERAAAERAVIAAARPVLGMLRGTHSTFNTVIYSQALGDALEALDALDGAAKEV